MKSPLYPFSAIVGQEEMKLALLLGAIDWRLGVLLHGEKGAGKTTAARGLATLLPQPSPFINLPVGATEDRLLGGLHLEKMLAGEPLLKRGLLSEAHEGVLYVDEINLLPTHLGDALLDAAASGILTIEREGFSDSHAAEFLLLGSMNPEEGSLRPQLLDRFALAVDVVAPLEAVERKTIIERRIAFEQDSARFASQWVLAEEHLREQIARARYARSEIVCSSEIFAHISEFVCESGVRSLRADLAILRAAVAYAALLGDSSVSPEHVSIVSRLALAHRRRERTKSPAPRHQTPAPQPEDLKTDTSSKTQPERQESVTRVFAPLSVETLSIKPSFEGLADRGTSTTAPHSRPAPVVGSRRTETPAELDVRATLNHALMNTGSAQPTISNLHERVRTPLSGVRYLFVIDSSGSHAVQERMRLIKGAANGILNRSFKNGDEVAIIAFRGTEAQVLLEPTGVLQDATTALEYLPTGGRTPLAHALNLAQNYLTPSTIVVLLTDGRANVPIGSGDAWQQALDIAAQIKSSALVIDTENSGERLGNARTLADALGAEHIRLESEDLYENVVLALRDFSLGASSRDRGAV